MVWLATIVWTATIIDKTHTFVLCIKEKDIVVATVNICNAVLRVCILELCRFSYNTLGYREVINLAVLAKNRIY